METLKLVAELATKFGIIPACFMLLLVYFAHQNQDLQKQNSKLLDQMFELVKTLAAPPPAGSKGGTTRGRE